MLQAMIHPVCSPCDQEPLFTRGVEMPSMLPESLTLTRNLAFVLHVAVVLYLWAKPSTISDPHCGQRSSAGLDARGFRLFVRGSQDWRPWYFRSMLW